MFIFIVLSGDKILKVRSVPVGKIHGYQKYKKVAKIARIAFVR